MKHKIRAQMLTGAIISIILYLLLLVGAIAISQVAAAAGYTDIVVLYNFIAIFSIVGITLASVCIVASSEQGKAFKRERWAIVTSATLDMVIGIIGFIGAIKVAATFFTYLIYFAVFCAGIAIFEDFFKANKMLQQEAVDTEVVVSHLFPAEATPPSAPIQPVQTTTEKPPLRDTLIEAKALFEEGLITEQEYAERKQSFLSEDDKKQSL